MTSQLTTLRNGMVALADARCPKYPRTYANRTQAQAAAVKLAAETGLSATVFKHPAYRPFYVVIDAQVN